MAHKKGLDGQLETFIKDFFYFYYHYYCYCYYYYYYYYYLYHTSLTNFGALYLTEFLTDFGQILDSKSYDQA